MNNHVKNFITAGSEFTAGTSDIELAKENPTAWPHFLLPILTPEFFVNLAIPESGNFSTINNLIYLLETKKHIDPADTLIVIGFTGLARLDIMCAVDHPNANQHFSWDIDLEFGWITNLDFTQKVVPFNGILQKNMGVEQIEKLNCLSVVQGLSYLEANNFNYFFILMDEYILIDSPDWFKSFLTQRQSKWIKFNQYQTMHEFIRANNSNRAVCHLSVDDHRSIADLIASVVKKFI